MVLAVVVGGGVPGAFEAELGAELDGSADPVAPHQGVFGVACEGLIQGKGRWMELIDAGWFTREVLLEGIDRIFEAAPAGFSWLGGRARG